MHLAVAHLDRLLGVVVFDALGAVPDGGGEALGEHLMAALTAEQRTWVGEYSAREEAGDGSAEESLEVLRTLWPYHYADPASAQPMPEMGMDLEGHLSTRASISANFEAGTLERGLPQLRMPALILHGAASTIPASEASGPPP